MRSMFQTACSDRKVQRKSLKIREEFIPLKSLGGNTVPVQVRSPAPLPENPLFIRAFGCCCHRHHCPAAQQAYFNPFPIGDIPDELIFEMVDHSYVTVIGTPLNIN